MPALVIECKNANNDDAIALGVDQICLYCFRDRKAVPIAF